MKVLIPLILLSSSFAFGQTTVSSLQKELNAIGEGFTIYDTKPMPYSVARERARKMNEFMPRLERIYKAQSSSLDDATERYKKAYSVFERLNPLHEEANECYKQDVRPKERNLQKIVSLLGVARVINTKIQAEASPIAFEEYDGYVCGVYNPSTELVERKKGTSTQYSGVYNPHTKKVEWKEMFFGSSAGVYNPHTQKVEWKEVVTGTVGGVYNPVTKTVEWKTNISGGVGGVFNPHTKTVEWKSKMGSSVAGVYNPDKKVVEWKEKWHGGVAGAYDPTTKTVLWKENGRGTVSVVIRPPLVAPFSTTCGSNYPPEAYKEEE